MFVLIIQLVRKLVCTISGLISAFFGAKVVNISVTGLKIPVKISSPSL